MPKQSIYNNGFSKNDMRDCVLCESPLCSAKCSKGLDPGKILRSIWFDNSEYASISLPEKNPCIDCDAPCEKGCIKSGKVSIKELINRLYELKSVNHEVEKIDYSCLKTQICGIPLENPFLLSSSVVASTYDMCARAFEAGWAGICFKTITSFQVHEASPRFSAIEGDGGEIVGFKNVEQLSNHSVEEDMKILHDLKANYPSKFIMASIMGQNEEEWEYLAAECERNGADAVELNFSCPNMSEGGLGSDIGQVPELVERYTRAAKSRCNIPVLVKPTPNVDNMTPAADAAIRGGADGFAAINTIKSITGINIHTYVPEPAVHGMSALGGYSGPAVKPIALRFVMELAKNPKLDGRHISGMGGVETWVDALEYILLGAESIQVTTAVMKYGYRIVEDLIDGLALYMNQKGLKSIKELAGQSLDFVNSSTDVLERDTILFPHFDIDKCIGCGRCVISCRDGGHQALELTKDRQVKFSGKKCVGCHLCVHVCPQKAVSPAKKRFSPS